jgi:lysyl-tRNA synthetase class 2
VSAEERLAKLERLRAEGVDPYPFAFPDRTPIAEIIAAHDPAALGEGEHGEHRYRIAGRVTGQRGHGKTSFLDVRDLSGTIQAYARADALGEEAFDRVEELDIGDLVGVEGDLYVTKRSRCASASCWPRRCAIRPTSSTASPIPRSATASASST